VRQRAIRFRTNRLPGSQGVKRVMSRAFMPDDAGAGFIERSTLKVKPG